MSARPRAVLPDTLSVRLGDRIAGTLVHAGREKVLFTFDSSYVDDDARPTLSLSFKSDGGGLLDEDRFSRVRLLPFFSNLLPEGHLRQYLASRGGIHPDREFFLLWMLGTDLPGNVIVESPEGTMPDLASTPGRQRGERNQPLRFSLAGVQLKFSALMDASGGLTVPVDGVGGDWILKLPSAQFEQVPENEFAMMTLAGAVGIDVPEVRLIPTGDVDGLPDKLPEAFGLSLAVRRFDRTETGGRTHIEDFAQVFGVYPWAKYERASYGSLGRVLWREADQNSIIDFVRRLTFNVLIGNADAHLKNWSLIYRDGRSPALAPAYDLLSTVAYLPADKLALSLGGTKEFGRVTGERFEEFARQSGLPSRLVLTAARETAARLRDVLPRHEPFRALSPRLRKAIASHLKTVRL